MKDKVKYPRTYHLPHSHGTSDDKFLKDDSQFKGKEVVVTEKMDGENTTLYFDYLHARSLDYSRHTSRDLVKAFHAKIRFAIPEHIRICCENVTAQHSIYYSDLPFFLFGLSAWENDICFSWDESCEWFETIGIPSAPVLYRGIYNADKINKIYTEYASSKITEGYVIRVADEFKYDEFKNNVAKFVRPKHVAEDEQHWLQKKVTLNGFGLEYK